MPFLVEYVQSGVSSSDYDRLKAKLSWRDDPPPGALFHVVAFEGDTVHISQVWESLADLDAFNRSRVASALEALKLPSAEPAIRETYDLATFAGASRYQVGARSGVG